MPINFGKMYFNDSNIIDKEFATSIYIKMRDKKQFDVIGEQLENTFFEDGSHFQKYFCIILFSIFSNILHMSQY